MNQSKEGWVVLKDLREGAVFVTREGIYAVKSEYRYTGDPQSQCECVLLASGEYAHFRDGNQTLVREVSVAGLAESVTGPSTELLGERDAHFAGFAKLLWDEMVNANEYSYIDVNTDDDGIDPTNYRLLIAQRAYDLAMHILMHTTPAAGSTIRKFQGLSIEEIAGALPDLTEWPVGPV